MTYDLVTFAQDVNEVLLYVGPLVLCVVLWRLFVTKRTTATGHTTILGLTDRAPDARVDLIS